MLKHMIVVKGWVIIGLLVILVGCSRGITPKKSTTPSPSKTLLPLETQITATPALPGGSIHITPSAPTPNGPGLQSLIESAKADLATRLAISADDIILLEASSVVWPDTSLGCPQPGMQYAQVLTPGYLIRLGAGTQAYEYHTSRETTVLYCANPSPPVSGTPSDI